MRKIEFVRKIAWYGHRQLVISVPKIYIDLIDKDAVYKVKLEKVKN